jgi:hypothetical protein
LDGGKRHEVSEGEEDEEVFSQKGVVSREEKTVSNEEGFEFFDEDDELLHKEIDASGLDEEECVDMKEVEMGFGDVDLGIGSDDDEEGEGVTLLEEERKKKKEKSLSFFEWTHSH